jgi:hypothetical protein
MKHINHGANTQIQIIKRNSVISLAKKAMAQFVLENLF